MAHSTPESKRSPLHSAIERLNPLPNQSIFETLERRELLSGATSDLHAESALMTAPTQHQNVLNVKTPTIHPAETSSQKAADKAAAAAAKRQARITKLVTAFEAHINLEVKHNARKINDARFLKHIANEQAAFAHKIAKLGGTYTPILIGGSVGLGSGGDGGGVTVGTGAPTSPTLTATVASASEIDLNWTAVNGASAYQLEFSTDGGTTFNRLATPATTSYSHVGLTSDTAFKYRVSALTGAGSSAPSTVVTATTLLSSPAGFSATATSSTSVTLLWTALTDATTYKIERSLNGTTWTTLAPSPALTGTSSTYTDSTLTAGTSYFYRVSAVGAAGTSAPTTPASVLTLAAAPALTAAPISASEIDLTWSSVPTAFNYKLESSSNGGSTWSTLTTTPATSFNNTALSTDTTYQYRVSAINGAGTSAASTVVTKATLLAPPTDLSASTFSATRIDLSWTAVTDATGYKFERSPDNTTWTALVPSPALTGTSVSYTDAAVLAGTTYYYRISSIDAAGTSLASGAVHALTLPVAPTPTATTISASQINLSWTSSTGAASYLLEVSKDSGASWATLAAPSTTTYNNTALTADTSYQYRVTAINATGPSTTSAPITATTLLAAPLNLVATVTSSTQIALTWTLVPDATGFKLERSPDGNTWTALVPSPALTGTSVSYNDATVSAATTYYYRLSAIDAAGTSAASATVHALTTPAAPTLSTPVVASATQLNLSWTASTGAASYKLESSADGGTTWTTLATPTATIFSNSGLNPDSTLKYRVSAVNATGASVPSAVVTATTLLAAPTGLVATPVSATSVSLAWTAVTDATGFKLERSPDGTAWTTLVPSPALTGTSVSYTDATVLAGTNYFYRLSAIDASGTSLASASVQALTPPVAPVLSAPTVVSASQINLSWTASVGAASYKVESSTDGGSTWVTIATPTTLTYNNTSLNADTTYKYRVSAVNATGTSAPTAPATATTILAAPTGLAATAISATQINLVWTSVIDATSYKLERSPDGITFTTLVPSPALTGSSVSYSDTTVLAGTTYYYRLSAIDASGTSVASTQAHAQTVPAATTLTAAVNSASQITLTWPVSASSTSYRLETSLDGGATWTTLASPTTPTYVNTGLTADTAYKYRVSAINATGASALSPVVTTTTLLSAPAGLSATTNSATQITVAWSQTLDATGYKLERSTDGTTFTTLVPSPALTGSSVSYTDSSVIAGTTYYYRLSGIDAAGTSAASAAVHTQTFAVAPTLTSSVVSGTQINLSWTASTSATSYRVESSTDGVTWTTLASPTTLTYQNTGLTPNSTYRYRVSAINPAGTGAASATVVATTIAGAPTNVAATPVSATNISLTWTVVANATTYKIERSLDGNTWATITPSPALTGTSNSYSDTNVLAGTTYYYRISTVNSLGTSVASAAAHTLSLPAAPTLTATVASASQINLSWTASTSATSYKLETSVDGGTTWTILAAPTTATTFSDTSLVSDIAHKYRVTALNASGASALSTVVTATTPLSSPASFATTVASATEVDLTWVTILHSTTYKLERSTDNLTWTQLVPSPALTGASTSYNDTTPLAGTTYFYRITAIGGSGNSVPSPAIQVLTLPAQPTLTATPVSPTTINLSWTASLSASSYTLETSTDGGTTWTALTPTPTGTTYSNTGLTVNSSYKYRVTAINATGNSVVSAVVSNGTLVATPTGFAVTPQSSTEIDLAWTAVTGATGYKIERSLDGTTFTTLSPSPALTGTDATYADTGLASGTTYYYRLSALGTAGQSVPSSVIQTLTLPASITLTATANSASRITLSWNAAASATDYHLEQSADSGTTWTTLTPTPTTTGYVNSGLLADKLYQYRVTAINASGSSGTSAVAAATTFLAAPAGFGATPSSATQVALAWTAVTDATGYTIERSVNGTTWTTLSPSPALTGTSATYNDATVVAGTNYSYRISAVNALGASVPSSVQQALTLPATPTLTAVAVSTTQINLSWTASKSATSYTLELSPDSGTTWTALTPTPTGTSYSATGIAGDTLYQFRVTAVNASGNSVTSSVVSATTPVGVVTGLAATASSSTAIALAWSPVTDATGYLIERSLNQASWTALTPSPALTGTSGSYTDNTVAAGTTYYYRVTSISAAGNSAATAPVHALTQPASPTLTATTNSATQITLTWTGSASATSYTLESSTDSGTTWTALTPTPTTTSYVNSGLTPDTSYQYRVSAVNASGASATSAVVTRSTLLSAPTGFGATAASATEIDLAWTAVTNATNYKIERSLNQFTWATLSPSPALTGTSATYADTGLTPGTTYYYRISAIGAAGTSAPTAVVHALSDPATPTLTATVNSATQITLTWTPSFSATSYTLETSTDSGTTWTALTPTPIAASYVNSGLTSNTSYEYRVSAVNASGASATSTVVTATTLLAAPAGFTATTASATEIDLAWTAVTNATGYKIERSVDNLNWATLVPSPALTGTSATYADASVSAGTTYYYRIAAIGAGGNSATAPVAHALSDPATPVLAANSDSATQITLSWTTSFSASSYTLEISSDAGTTWTAITPAPTTATYVKSGLTADTSYQFRVTAVNTTGNSAVSNVVTASTLLGAPTGFTVTNASATENDLAWTAVAHATGYKIERSVNQSVWTTLTPSPALTGTSATYADTGVAAGTTYYYRISSVNVLGTSVATAVAHVLTVPAAPTLTATPASSTAINLAWNPTKSASSYVLEISADSGTTWTAVSPAPTGTGYASTGLTADTSYEYRVSAVNATGASVTSTVVTVSTILAPPTGFSATTSSATQINLAWTAVTHATGYLIQRSSDNVNFTALTPSPALTGSSATYTDTGLTAGTLYYYRISAIDGAGTSVPAAVVHATTALRAPTGLAASAVSATQVNLTWTAVTAPGLLNYLLQSSTDNVAFSTVATIGSTSNSASDTHLTTGTLYYYRLIAVNVGGNSAPSTVASTTTL